MKITFLGTGANGGVPQVDCRCQFCASGKGERRRSCLLIEVGKKKLIVDCGPDFREQLLSQNLRIDDLAGIALSHLHWDHCSGLTELSAGKKLSISVVVPKLLKTSLKTHRHFSFLFENGWAKFKNKPGNFGVEFIKIPHDPKFATFAVKISASGKTVLIATDIARLTNRFLKEAESANLVILDGTFLGETKHWHIAIMESVPKLALFNKNVIFTHINHSEDPSEIKKFLKKFGFKLAFDAMEVEV